MTRDLGAMHVFHGPNDYPTLRVSL